MNPRLIGIGKMIAVLSGGVLVVAVVAIVLQNSERPFHPIPWSEPAFAAALDSQNMASIPWIADVSGRERVVLEAASDVSQVFFYPVRRDNDFGVGVVAVAGHNGAVIVAAAFDANGMVGSSFVVQHAEARYLYRDLQDGVLDATSGATITAAAVRSAETRLSQGFRAWSNGR